MKKKAVVLTYGCRQNVSDSEKILYVLENMGYDIGDVLEEADLVIFNTCAVREGAEERVYGNIGALKPIKKKRPHMIIAVCGCMAARAEVQKRIKVSFPYVNLVFGTNDIHNLKDYLEEVEEKRIFLRNSDETVHEIPSKRGKKIVANVPVMFGCNNFCSYCIVPYVRGRERSRKSIDIIDEICHLVENGTREVLLLGQNVNSYKSDIDFPDLLKKVAEIEGLRRIRFISSHPKDFSDKLINVMSENDKICKQLHLPFQAGSNKVLKDMNRNYTREHYISLIERARKVMPNLTITSDVIVGFPTETQSDFEETLDLVKMLKLDSLFTFIYSRREGTPAFDLDFELPSEKIKENFNILIKTQEKIAEEINAKFLNCVCEVLNEGESKNNKNFLTGRTDGGKIVNFPKNEVALMSEILQVKIVETNCYALSGVLA